MAIKVVESSLELSISGQELACVRAMLRIAQTRIRDAKSTFPKDAKIGNPQIAHHLECTTEDIQHLAACSDEVCTAFGAWSKT